MNFIRDELRVLDILSWDPTYFLAARTSEPSFPIVSCFYHSYNSFKAKHKKIAKCMMDSGRRATDVDTCWKHVDAMLTFVRKLRADLNKVGKKHVKSKIMSRAMNKELRKLYDSYVNECKSDLANACAATLKKFAMGKIPFEEDKGGKTSEAKRGTKRRRALSQVELLDSEQSDNQSDDQASQSDDRASQSDDQASQSDDQASQSNDESAAEASQLKRVDMDVVLFLMELQNGASLRLSYRK